MDSLHKVIAECFPEKSLCWNEFISMPGFVHVVTSLWAVRRTEYIAVFIFFIFVINWVTKPAWYIDSENE